MNAVAEPLVRENDSNATDVGAALFVCATTSDVTEVTLLIEQIHPLVAAGMVTVPVVMPEQDVPTLIENDAVPFCTVTVAPVHTLGVLGAVVDTRLCPVPVRIVVIVAKFVMIEASHVGSEPAVDQNSTQLVPPAIWFIALEPSAISTPCAVGDAIPVPPAVVGTVVSPDTVVDPE